MSDLNTRARDALRGEWLPGMRIWRLSESSGERQYMRLSETYPVPYDLFVWHPDLDDRVTELALIAVIEARIGGAVDVRVSWTSPVGDARARGVESVEVSWWSPMHRDWLTVEAPSRKDALLAALEAT